MCRYIAAPHLLALTARCIVVEVLILPKVSGAHVLLPLPPAPKVELFLPLPSFECSPGAETQSTTAYISGEFGTVMRAGIFLGAAFLTSGLPVAHSFAVRHVCRAALAVPVGTTE